MTDSNLVNNAVVASASSQYVSIVPENGEQFNPGQKIIYNIEPEIGFIKKDSYLVFDIVNNSSRFDRTSLYKTLGAHGIIDRVDIFSKETGVLLESNTHYAQWCNVENQYLYDDHNNLSNHQGVGKPIQSWTHQKPSNGDPAVTVRDIPNPKMIENNQLSPVDNQNRPAYTSRRFCIPLMVGLFGAYEGGEKAIPILAFGGLRIEITLAQPKLALQQMGWNYVDTTYQSQNHHRMEDWVAGIDLSARAGDQSGGNNIVVRLTKGVATNGLTSNLQDTGLVVGNVVKVTGATQASDNAVIPEFVGAITALTLVDDKNVVVNGHTKTLKTHLDITIQRGVAGPEGLAATGSIKLMNVPNYKVTSTEFRLLQVVPPPNIADSMSKGINYEYTGYEVFFDNIPTSALRHQIPIHSVASKALATFTILTDSSNDEGQLFSANDIYAGALPDKINLNNVVYFINNRLYPLRSYNPDRLGDKVLATNELVKAWRALGKQPMNLGSADYGDLENYTNTPLIARELARGGMVFDLRNAEPELRLAFSAARANIIRANTYVFSKKIVQTTATGVQVIH